MVNIKEIIANFIFGTRRFSNRYTKNFAKKIENKKILEIGSGKGKHYTVKKFFDNSNEFIQSDINPEYGHKIVDATKMNYQNEFDIIICINVLEHVFDFKKIIDNIYVALKPNGTALFYIPTFYPIHCEPEDYWRFTEHSLRKLLKKFSHIKIKYPGLRRYPFAYYIEAIK